MGLIFNGNKPSKIIYNGVESALYFNGSKIWPEGDPLNPLNLPANTIRVRTNDGQPPVKGANTSYETAMLVSGTNDVYDVYKSGTNFNSLLRSSTNVIEVLGAGDLSSVTDMSYMFLSCSSLTTVPLFDTSKVTTMYRMFKSCSSLTSVPLFDTSSVTSMREMLAYCSALTSVPLFDTSSATNMNSTFSHCNALTSIPLFNTSNVTDMSYMFDGCTNVQSGALALYQQASTQTTPPTTHNYTFANCGSNTVTGTAELAQIPDDWK